MMYKAGGFNTPAAFRLRLVAFFESRTACWPAEPEADCSLADQANTGFNHYLLNSRAAAYLLGLLESHPNSAQMENQDFKSPGTSPASIEVS
jgi:hypothetical protein